MDAPTQLMAGGVLLTTPSAENMRLFILLWGDSGSGKTTLAATAPGTKLFILLDPGGDLSLVDRNDVAVRDLCTESPSRLIAQFNAADPFSIGKILAERQDIETVVFDSMTSYAYTALQNAVMINKSTMERPGQHGYQYRNSSVVRACNVLMQICNQHKRHLVIITHEGTPNKNDDGAIVSVTMALSESAATQIGMRFNEVWHLSDTGTERRIAVRPCRSRKPMKTRLFNADKPEFVWHYNPDNQSGEGIADWYHAWQASGGKKLPLPTRGGKK